MRYGREIQFSIKFLLSKSKQVMHLYENPMQTQKWEKKGEKNRIFKVEEKATVKC